MPTSFVRSYKPIVLAIALVAATALASCGGNSSSMPTSSSEPPVVVTIIGNSGGMSFSPETATIKKGQPVMWRNTDSITHAIAQDGGGFSTGAIPAGATSASVMVSSSGTVPYHCTIHPSMVGSLTVQ